MGWHPPVPAAILDADNTEWQVIRAWPDDSALTSASTRREMLSTSGTSNTTITTSST